MQKHEITCDGCGGDITYTRNSVDYRLALNVEHLPIHPDARTVTDLGIYPPLKRDAHFCDVGCLAGWLRDNHPTAIDGFDARRQRVTEWREQIARRKATQS